MKSTCALTTGKMSREGWTETVFNVRIQFVSMLVIKKKCLKLYCEKLLLLWQLCGIYKHSAWDKCTVFNFEIIITISANIVARIFRRIERKIENVIGEDHFGVRKGKETRNAARMQQIVSERTWEVDEQLCTWFKNCQKITDIVKWTK
jgi:hypothetical protein